MVYKEGDRASWIQNCIFKDGEWIPFGRPYLNIKGLKTGKRKATKQKERIEKKKEEFNKEIEIDEVVM